MEIPTLGPGPPPTPEGGNAAAKWERRGTTSGRIGEVKRRGTTLGRVGEEEQGIRDHSTLIDRRAPPPTRMDEDLVEGKREDSQNGQPGKSSRQPHISRELRMLDHSDEPLQKRVRRPVR